MAEWYVKDLSKLTHVSVQTLHHYDRIGLLTPSIRLSNGYRIYSEKDLLKLQQIIALKFFGFELTQIKTLLSGEVNVLDHFKAQSRLLEEKAHALLEARNTLTNLVADSNNNKSIPWENIVKTIEVYRMTKELENTWATKVFNQEELREYASFEKEYQARYNEKQRAAFSQEWTQLVAAVKANLKQDPMSEIGIEIGERTMQWVNKIYGNHISVRNAMWHKGFKEGNLDPEDAMPAECVTWMDKAIDAYWRNRVFNILKQINVKSDLEVLKQWNDLLNDMCGDNKKERNDFMQIAYAEPEISEATKNWLRKFVK